MIVASCAESSDWVFHISFSLDPQSTDGTKWVRWSGRFPLAERKGPHGCPEAEQACGPRSQILSVVGFEMPQSNKWLVYYTRDVQRPPERAHVPCLRASEA